MATRQDTPSSLSSLARDPVLRAFFERSERDSGASFAVPSANSPRLSGGAVKAARPVLELA